MNVDKGGAFCFRCSAKDPRHDSSRWREPLHNPWPLLVPNGGLEYVRSSPLVRAFYSPVDLRSVLTIRARREAEGGRSSTASDHDDFRDWLIWLHETAHLYYLDWTPAKELAKIHLAFSHAAILNLLFISELRDEHIAANWLSLERSAQQLDQIELNIVYVEELIATAISLRAMKKETANGGLWTGFTETLEALREEFLDQDDYLPGFRDAYERIASLIELMYGNAGFVALVMPLLQPVVIGSASTALPYALDSRTRLKEIIDLLEGVDHPVIAADAVQRLAEEEVSTWRILLSLQLDAIGESSAGRGDFMRHYSSMVHRLWRITRGNIPDGPTNDTIEQAGKSVAGIRSQVMAGKSFGPTGLLNLHPHWQGGRRYIGLVEWPLDADSSSEKLQIDHRMVLFCEGLRQQLLAGKGINCPNNIDGTRHCYCPKPIRQSMKRLADVAGAGAFGPGQWSQLPCRT